MFYAKNVTVLCFTFNPMIHFGLFFNVLDLSPGSFLSMNDQFI